MQVKLIVRNLTSSRNTLLSQEGQDKEHLPRLMIDDREDYDWSSIV
jgi:hypothetical protein